MSWVDVGQIATAAVLSAGGISAIIVGAVHFSVNQIAERLAKKYEAKLAQETEKYKSELSKKEYVSKTRFDTEFQIYRDLNVVFFDLVKEINMLIPSGLAYVPADKQDREELEERQLREAMRLAVNAQDTLNKNAPFIAKTFYDAYDSILQKCRMQINVIREKYNAFNFCKDKGEAKLEDYKRTNEINLEFQENNNSIREYLASLDVME